MFIIFVNRVSRPPGSSRHCFVSIFRFDQNRFIASLKFNWVWTCKKKCFALFFIRSCMQTLERYFVFEITNLAYVGVLIYRYVGVSICVCIRIHICIYVYVKVFLQAQAGAEAAQRLTALASAAPRPAAPRHFSRDDVES